jgi:hypothetical protein
MNLLPNKVFFCFIESNFSIIYFSIKMGLSIYCTSWPYKSKTAKMIIFTFKEQFPVFQFRQKANS